MNPFMMLLVGYVAGLGLGLLFIWGIIGILIAGVAAAVLLIGAFVPFMPLPIRAFFGLAVAGFLSAFVLGGGMELL